MIKPKVRYIYSVDHLRGIASLMVAFYHFSSGYRDYLPMTNPLHRIGHFGWVGVEIFFIISGLVIPFSLYIKDYKLKSYGRFVLKRIIRLDPPYLLSILLAISLEAASAYLYPYYRGKPFSINPVRLLLHLGYLNAFFNYPWYNPVYWSLAIEFQYYLMIGLIFPLLIHKNWIIRISTILTFIALHFAIPSSKFIFGYSILFAIGITLFYYFINDMRLWQAAMAIVLLLILTFKIHGIVIGYAATFTVLFILLWKIHSRVLRFFGKISYSLYLVHVLIGGRVINVFDQFVHNEILRSIGVFIALGIAIFAAWIFYIIIEKPSMILSKKISYTGLSKQQDPLPATQH